MGFVHVALVLLSLLSAGQSAPVTSCESLLQPLEIQGRDQLLGRWTYIADSTDIPGSAMLMKMFVETIWLNITAGDNNDTINIAHNQKMNGVCVTLSYKDTVKSNTISIESPYPASGILLTTSCPDCLVIYTNSTFGQRTYKGVQLLSRRPKVSETEIEELSKQITCLNLPKPTVLDPEKGFCSEESQGRIFDLSDSMNSMGSDQMNILDQIFRSEGVQKLQDIFSSIVYHIISN